VTPWTIHLLRDTFGADWTLSRLLIDYGAGAGPQPFGYACEDVDRGLDQSMPLADIAARKIKGRTAIPAGTYEIVLEQSGKYGPDTPTVASVPGYRYIRIHAGNDHDDTEGCLLPGLGRDTTAGTVARSRAAVDWLRATLKKQIDAGGTVQIVIGRDGKAWKATGR
jgi:hypothetical protein